MKKRVAAIVTEYRHWSHADLIVGKILEGYNFDGGPGPGLRLASLYTDKVPKNDTSRLMAKKHGFRLSPTITDALTLGGTKLAVDGVIIIAEHGDYPTNARDQIDYPKKRFFAEVADVFEKSGRAVPVFSDKHLGGPWDDCKWIYDRAREVHAPLMAGSTLPLTWRKPSVQLPLATKLDAAVAHGYGPPEAYGFHALEMLQCIAERRQGGETGVKAVQHLRGEAMWKLLDEPWAKPLLEATLPKIDRHANGDIRAITIKTADASAWRIEYRDGLQAAVAVTNGWIHECDGGSFFFAAQPQAPAAPLVTQFYLQQPDPFAHFGLLLDAIESMIRTGHPAYPVERTLLTSGILDAIMTSRAENDRRVETPHLAIAYEPGDWAFATGPIPPTIQRPRLKTE